MAGQNYSRRAGWVAYGIVLFSLAGLLLAMQRKVPAKFAARAPIVQIVFPVGSGCQWHHVMRIELERIVANRPNVRHLSIGVTPDDRTAAIIELAPGSDAGNVIASLEQELMSWQDAHPYLLRPHEVTIVQRMSSQLILVRIEGVQAWRAQLLLCNRSLDDLINQLNQVHAIDPAVTQSDRHLCVKWLELDVRAVAQTRRFRS